MVTKRLNEVNVNILILDLFELCVDLLKEQNLLEDIFDLEKDEDAAYFLDAFDSALNDDIITDHIQRLIQDTNPDVVFIQGVGKIGENKTKLNEWLDENARVAFVECEEPWLYESSLIKQLDLPMNLEHNKQHLFYTSMKKIRSDARKVAKGSVKIFSRSFLSYSFEHTK